MILVSDLVLPGPTAVYAMALRLRLFAVSARLGPGCAGRVLRDLARKPRAGLGRVEARMTAAVPRAPAPGCAGVIDAAARRCVSDSEVRARVAADLREEGIDLSRVAAGGRPGIAGLAGCARRAGFDSGFGAAAPFVAAGRAGRTGAALIPIIVKKGAR